MSHRVDLRSEVGRSRSAFVCDFGVTRPASRFAWAIPAVWQFVLQPHLAEAGGVTARMRRARRSRPTLLLVTLAGGVTPPVCGARWRTLGTIQAGAFDSAPRSWHRNLASFRFFLNWVVYSALSMAKSPSRRTFPSGMRIVRELHSTPPPAWL